MAIKGRKASKNPPILSHEFIIQNHADIVSCVAMVFVIGLMIQATSPLAYMFIAIHHNVTKEPETNQLEHTDTFYTNGWKDICAVFFYFLICIVMHAIVQDFVLDKISRKLHLSKVKHAKFNESGQLLVFYIISVLWGGDVIFRENYLLDISLLWEGYPRHEMVFMFKFFFIIQLAYWLHCYPELYFQKVKRDEMPARIQYATIALFFVFSSYILNFTRVGICLLVLHYASEGLFHAARLLYIADKAENGTKMGYHVANVLFVFVRLGSIILTVLTFWYGLSLSEQGLDLSTGNFNIQAIRISALAAVFALQAWLMWNFITFHLKRRRELSVAQPTARKPRQDKKSTSKKKKDETKHKRIEDDDLPEVDQNTKKSLRSRASAKNK